MMKILLLLSSAAVLTLAADEVISRAIVRLDGSDVSGNITFTQLPNGNLRVSGKIMGMPPGMYGFHVHQKGDITGGCGSTLGHFNPNGNDHGHPSDENRHVGDLGNVVFDSTGVANVDFEDHQIKLMGRHSIIGRAVVLHERGDDFGRSSHPDSKKTGNAGGRVACGVIGILESTLTNATNAASMILGTSWLILFVIPLIV